MSALIIIDMQNDFMPWGSLAVPDADKIIKTIKTLMEKFEHIYATKDWHPPDHVSFALNHARSPGEEIELKDSTQKLWPEHCVIDSLGAEIVSPIDQKKIEKVFTKGSDPLIDSYSAFFDNARKKKTGLASYLKKKNISKLYFVGVATDYCVKFSVLDALDLGFNVYLIQDACQSISKDPIEAIAEMRQKGAHIIASSDIV